MYQLSCPNCYEDLEMQNKRYICPCCEREWNQIILSNKKLFNPRVVSNINSIIATEYCQIQNLLESKQIYGIIFQIKDLYEIIIRIPVLITCAYVLKQDLTLKSKELLHFLMSKPLSLGDWRYLLNNCKTIVQEYESFPQEISLLINTVRKFVNSDKTGDIVYWRNNTIAHGATKAFDDVGLYNDMAQKLEELTGFFAGNSKIFNDVIIETDTHLIVEGEGFDFSNLHGRLYCKTAASQFLLYPFFDIRREGIFLYDRYFFKQRKTDIIEYVNSQKQTVDFNEIDSLYLESCSSSQSNSVGLDSYSIEERNLCEEFLNSGEFLTPDFLVDWLQEKISPEKNVFMLQMDRGMGKSFFVRGLDPNSIDKIFIDDVSVKSFYINSTYHSRIDDFSIYVEDLMRKVSKGMTLANSTYRLNINTDTPQLEFASFLNHYKESYYADKKLLFIFDGIDETNVQEGLNVIDFIPTQDQLLPGIYVMVTSRTLTHDDHVAARVKQYIKGFSGDITSFDYTSPEYLAFAKNYFDLHIIKKIILSCKRNRLVFDCDFEKNDEYFHSIADKSILNLALTKELALNNVGSIIRSGADKISVHGLLTEKDMYEEYFSNISDFYGAKYFQRFIRVLCTLSIADRPLTIKELAILTGNDNLNIAFLGFINSIKLFIGTKRSETGATFEISHDEQKQIIRRIFKKEIAQTIDGIFDKILMVSNDKLSFKAPEEVVYYACFKNILEHYKQTSPDKVKMLLACILQLPIRLGWAKEYGETRNELAIIKNVDMFMSMPEVRQDTQTLLRIAFLLTNAGLNELIANNYPQSEYYFLNALKIYTEADSSLFSDAVLYDYAEMVSIYATLKWRIDESKIAAELYERCIDIKETLYASNSPLVTRLNLLSEKIGLSNILNSAKDFTAQRSILEFVETNIATCEDCHYKKRTLPFLSLSWFTYYRDTNAIQQAYESILKTIELYTVCVHEHVDFYPPDLIKCYNYLFNLLIEHQEQLSFADETTLERSNNLIMATITKELGYNDSETHLDNYVSLSLLFLARNNPSKSAEYKEKALGFFELLSEEARQNPKLLQTISRLKEVANG